MSLFVGPNVGIKKWFEFLYQYWTGLMLCLRCALFLVFAFNTQDDPSLNLLANGAVVMASYTNPFHWFDTQEDVP